MVSISVRDLGIEGKIICISMQRNGTSSVGNVLEAYGLNRVGSPVSNKRRWPIHWLNGNFEEIFKDDAFMQSEVLEDDPWWFPEFYKFLFHRFPGSKFILLDRNSDAWFKSMIHHSNGFTLGNTSIHAKLYRRENEVHWLNANVPNFGEQRVRELVLYDKAQHYMAIYEQYNREVKDFFKRVSPESLFYSNLSDPNLWTNMINWLGLPQMERTVSVSHAHKNKGVFSQENLLQSRKQWSLGRSEGSKNVPSCKE